MKNDRKYTDDRKYTTGDNKCRNDEKKRKRNVLGMTRNTMMKYRSRNARIMGKEMIMSNEREIIRYVRETKRRA